ncbi:hypothetical protein M5689_023081 [Euphorbia peplus]|nr:hypothetical protein M5689_023081 [Euphorbia peplus]
MTGKKIGVSADRRRTIRLRIRRAGARAVTQLANPNRATHVVTRKRKDGHQPTSSNEKLKYRSTTIEEIRKVKEQLICGDTSNGPSGHMRMNERTREVKEQLTPKISDVVVEELATRLFNETKEEFVQKLRCGVKGVIKAHPNFNIDMETLSADISSEGEEIESPTDGRRKTQGQFQGTNQPQTTTPSTIEQTILESIIEEMCSYGGNESESVEQPICGDTSDESSRLVHNHERIRNLYELFTPEVLDAYFDELLTRVVEKCKEKIYKKATSVKIRLTNTLKNKFREDNLSRFGNIAELPSDISSEDISSEDDNTPFSKSGCIF